ncbi:MAG: cupin domain-containing protein [Thiotrichales bacterium]
MANELEPAGNAEVLEQDIIETLAAGQTPVELPEGLRARMKQRLLDSVRKDASEAAPGFVTIRAEEGEWTEVAPGGQIKVLHTDQSSGTLTFLARLEPGFSLPAHYHEIAEECLMLEGDLQIGELELKAGDYHYAPVGAKHAAMLSKNGALVMFRGALPV